MSTAVNRIVGALKLGALAGLAAGVIRLLRRRPEPAATGEARWLPLTETEPVEPRRGPVEFTETATVTDESAQWADPVEGVCPSSHPIKGNVASGIYHVPGGLSYDRTIPQRCYATETDARGDGLRRAKR